MSKAKTAATMSGAGAIACCVLFTPGWEGMDLVAKRDMIGTGHPVTYCNGLTDEFGKVKVGQRFTPEECKKALALALPKYWDAISPYIRIPLPDKTAGALLDAAWNAGPKAVINSPMLAQMNAGNLRAGCNAFAGWYVRSDGQVRAGLIDRRNGEDHGDKRLSEKGLCLKGIAEGVSTGDPVTHALTLIVDHDHPAASVAVEAAAPPADAPAVAASPVKPTPVSVAPKRPAAKPAPKPALCWVFKC